MDPVSAIAAASTAFSLIKKGFAAGRDVESMYGDIGRWMGACSDVNQSVKMANNPPVFKNYLQVVVWNKKLWMHSQLKRKLKLWKKN